MSQSDTTPKEYYIDAIKTWLCTKLRHYFAQLNREHFARCCDRHVYCLRRAATRLSERSYSPNKPTTPPASCAITRSNGQRLRSPLRKGARILLTWKANHHAIHFRILERCEGSW